MIKGRWKRIAHVICFLAVFSLVWVPVQHVLSFKWRSAREHLYDRYRSFEAEPAGSIDVLYMGASSVNGGINPVVIYNEIGATGYNFGKTSTSAFASYYDLRYALKVQPPRLVVLELCDIGEDRDMENIAHYTTSLHKSIENMPDWGLRLEMAFAAERTFHLGLSDMVGGLLPLLRYHDRWQELTATDFKPDAFSSLAYKPFLKGTYMNKQVSNLSDLPLFDPETPAQQDAPISRAYYDKLLALCRENGIEVMAISVPRLNTPRSFAVNTRAWCEENGVPMLEYPDFESLAEIGISPVNSFYNEKHLNISGQAAFSRALARAIQETFQLEDHRGDPAYAAWDDAYAQYDAMYGAALRAP